MESFQSLIICFSQTYHDRQLCLPSGGHQIKTSISRTKCKFAIKIWLQRTEWNYQILADVQQVKLTSYQLMSSYFNFSLEMTLAVFLPDHLPSIYDYYNIGLGSTRSRSNLYILNRGKISIQFLSDQNSSSDFTILDRFLPPRYEGNQMGGDALLQFLSPLTENNLVTSNR